MPFIAMLLGEIIGAWLSDRVDRRAAACFISTAGAGIGGGSDAFHHAAAGNRGDEL